MSPTAWPTREELRRLVRWAWGIAQTLGKLAGQGYNIVALSAAAEDGLRQALGSFDPKRGVAFQAFAQVRIAGEVRDAIKAERKRAAREVSFDEGMLDEPEGAPPEVVAGFFATCVAAELGAGGQAGCLRKEAYAALHREMGLLPPRAGQVLILRYWKGLPWQEVGAAVGISEQQAKDDDRKVRARLKVVLSPKSPRRG